MTPERLFKAGLAALGFLVWTVIVLATATAADPAAGQTGFHDAWDSKVYFWVAAPVYVAAALFAGWRLPDGAWRWPLAIAIGQGLAMYAFGPKGWAFTLLPVALMSAMVASIPLFAAAYLGAGARRLQERRLAA